MRTCITVLISVTGAIALGFALSNCAQMDNMGGWPQAGDGSGGNPRMNPDPSFYPSNSPGFDGREEHESWGASALLTIANTRVFEYYRLGEPVNSLSDIGDFKVYVDLTKVQGRSYYEGEVTLAYRDYERGGNLYHTEYRSGSGDWARYNVWFKHDGKKYFHGFFQEAYGSLVLVIDNEAPQLRGGTKCEKDPVPDECKAFYEGSVWVMNFRTTYGKGSTSCTNYEQAYVKDSWSAPPSILGRNKPCWLISSGALDCRTWREGRGVNTFKAVEPDGICYRRLATFTRDSSPGLNILKAFNVSRLKDIIVHTAKKKSSSKK